MFEKNNKEKKQQEELLKFLQEDYFIGKKIIALNTKYSCFEKHIIVGNKDFPLGLDIPSGLWYGIEGEEIKWSIENQGLLPIYIYEIEVKSDVILKLTNCQEMEDFYNKYKREESYANIDPSVSENIIKNAYLIDWSNVMEDYKGIEINPYQWVLRYIYFWYYLWNIPCGCLFEESAIKNIRLIAKFTETKEKYKLYL